MKKFNAMKEIPKNTCYCYTSDFKFDDNFGYKIKLCPFFTYKKTNFGSKCKKEDLEYCRYLKQYLKVQDQCKDCDIGHPLEGV